MSPEMEIPKLMWLKRARPEPGSATGRILDLADFLTFRACGSNARSCCTLTCKWTYLAHEEPGWQDDFLARSGSGICARGRGVPARGEPDRRAARPTDGAGGGRARADHRLHASAAA